MKSYDAIVIGTGQAGKPLAAHLGRAGWKVAIVEKGRVGGSCVVEGCTPTKTMVASGRVAHLARRAGDYGVRTGEVSVDLAVVRERKRMVVDSWSEGSRIGLEKNENVDLIMGHARFLAAHEVEVELNVGGVARITAPRIFINTGTRNRVPPIAGLDSVDWLDNSSLMELAEVPDHLVILGGGFIGVEFGQLFRRLGSQVTIVEGGKEILSREDPDVIEGVRAVLTEDGIDIRTGAMARSVARREQGVCLTVAVGEESEEICGSHLMVSVGRRPNSDDLGLEAAGIELDERGFIRVDDQLRTNVDGVWALGDVNGGPPFTHVAYDDFRVVRTNLLGGGGANRTGRPTPYTLFTDPQLGRIGMSESQARESGRNIRVAKLPMARVARAIEMDETRGFMKAVVDADSQQILGASILGIEGGEIASVVQVAMMGNLPWTDLRDGVFSHPTLSESLNNLFMTLD